MAFCYRFEPIKTEMYYSEFEPVLETFPEQFTNTLECFLNKTKKMTSRFSIFIITEENPISAIKNREKNIKKKPTYLPRPSLSVSNSILQYCGYCGRCGVLPKPAVTDSKFFIQLTSVQNSHHFLISHQILALNRRSWPKFDHKEWSPILIASDGFTHSKAIRHKHSNRLINL